MHGNHLLNPVPLVFYMVLLSVSVVLNCLFLLFYIIKKQSCFMYILKTEFLYLLWCYILSISLGGTVIYSFDTSTIFYCVTIPFLPSKKGTWVASRFCYYKQCFWDFFCVYVPYWTLDSAPPFPTAPHSNPLWKAFLIHIPWLEFKGVPQIPQTGHMEKQYDSMRGKGKCIKMERKQRRP